jgi:hypothetical protein
MAAGVGTMLTGVGVIVFQPRSFLPPWFGCFDCSDGTGGSMQVAGAALYVMMALAPVALASSLWRRIMHQRTRETTAVADGQSVAVRRDHPALRVLSNATIVLALIAGGLIVQAGYMIELTSDY